MTSPRTSDASLGSPDQAREYDVFVVGQVFFDIVLTGLTEPPRSGSEVFADGMGSCPGGVANFAVAAARLGLHTGLAAIFGDDVYADFLWRTLADQEGVDLSHARRVGNWHSPVTVSMSISAATDDGRPETDRAMVTHAHESPGDLNRLVGDTLATRAALISLDDPDQPWVQRVREAGGLLFADVGWDPTATWPATLLDRLDGFYAFSPNAVEAMAYTRTDSAEAAVQALADRVPLAIVTNGVHGVMAIDSETGEEACVPALPVRAYDPTGAGDVFAAALVLGCLHGWPLEQRLAFGNLCSGLSVQHFGGSLAAPGWGDIIDWYRMHARPSADMSAADAEALRHYGFIGDLLPAGPVPLVRRAGATIARFSDA